jgi:hypothetical protein
VATHFFESRGELNSVALEETAMTVGTVPASVFDADLPTLTYGPERKLRQRCQPPSVVDEECAWSRYLCAAR